MSKVFESYLNSGCVYSFANGPDVIRSREQAAQQGLNCIALMHLLIRELFDIELPDYLKGWEMYRDNPYLSKVPSMHDIKLGDMFFFGRDQLPSYAVQYAPQYDDKNELINRAAGDKLIGQQYAGVHLAMHTGEFNSAREPMLIHTNKIEGTIVIWPLARFLGLEQYSTIHAIKRVQI
jgi:hypothetical protein